MGRIREFSCPSCGMSCLLFLGHGMRHGTLENVLQEFSAGVQKKILADTKEEKIPSFEFNYRPAVCRQCKKILAVPGVYLHRTGQTYFGTCPECGGMVSVLQTDEKAMCPCCGGAVLEVNDNGNWD